MKRFQAAMAVICALLATAPADDACAQEPASNLPDLSGIAWVEGDMFLAVHDAKNGGETNRPRVSLVYRAVDEQGILWTPLDVAWPGQNAESNDLESIARIPGTRTFLLCESGDDDSEFQRIFLATLESPSNELVINEVVNWPVPVFNVEATAVALVGGNYYFAFAERAEGSKTTNVQWAPMQLNPLSFFGTFRSAKVTARYPAGPGVRPIVALDADSNGFLYAATAYDSGDDNGPFRSYASIIGQFAQNRFGTVFLALARTPGVIATQDGLKIEGVAVREEPGEGRQLYAGTDDENYGATMRQVWPLE